MNNNILICIDEDPLSKAVCEYGLFIAKNLNLDVTFLYVVKTAMLSPNFLGLATGGLVVTHEDSALLEDIKPSKEDIEKAENALNEVQKMALEKGINATTHLQSGDLIEILINYENANIIVVGIEHENEEIRNNIIALTRECEAKILFVNKEFSDVNSVLMAFDGEEASIKTLKFIKDSFIFGRNLEYHIVNISKDSQKSQNILEIAREILGDKNAKFISLTGNIAEELIKYRRANNLDMFIMGSFSKGIFATIFFGSTSQNVVEHALVPVFVSK